MTIIEKLKESGLVGRGGACYPTWKKWETVKKAKGKEKYVVCNAAEGEPGVKKDGYVIAKYPEKMIDGMNIAIKYINATKGVIYLNSSYYKKYGQKLKKLTKDTKIEIFKKPHNAGYIGGAETAALNTIEGGRTEPRLRPPFPTVSGLYKQPTIINNVETFYDASLIASGEYKKERLYTISGDCLWSGVYLFPENWTIERILKETKNFPDFDFFVQVGGDGSGEVLNQKQLKRQAVGAGSLTIYSMLKHDPLDLLKSWVDFFFNESCGKCTPCREGVFRLREILYDPLPKWDLAGALIDNLADTAFCGLGCAVPIPLRSFTKNVLPLYPENNIKLSPETKQIICECFN